LAQVTPGKERSRDAFWTVPLSYWEGTKRKDVAQKVARRVQKEMKEEEKLMKEKEEQLKMEEEHQMEELTTSTADHNEAITLVWNTTPVAAARKEPVPKMVTCCKDGLKKDGFNKDGFNKDGFNKDGFSDNENYSPQRDY
jgi:hypothetical protein